MKKTILSLVLLLSVVAVKAQQRYCFIDSRFILEKITDYKDAQTKLDNLSKTWQDEIDSKMAEVERMYKGYQAEKPMLSDEMRNRRQDEIVAREKEAKDLQKQRFGYEGDLFKKRQELVKPIQDKVYAAIQQFAEDKGYEFVFDKGSASGMLYADKRNDKTEDIKTMLKKG